MKNKLTAFIGLFLVSITTGLNAEAVEAQAVESAPSITIGEIFAFGGWVMWILVAISIFTLATIIYLLIAQRSEAIVPKALSRDVVEKIRVGQLVEARNLCDDKPCAYSFVAEVAISKVLFNTKTDIQALDALVASEGERQASKINGTAQWLLDISTVAPMVGLFGTVLGMLKAFSALGSSIAAAKPVYLAQGVSQALITTIAGLCIAIPALICYAFFRRRAEKRISELERAANEVVSTIVQG
ncbi:MAG: MotA/TolQ/ExbB proton channel family protein [Kiritimatiellae bacterium]|nr:MotA/TolQ/ExbB proton channel family protein [Kiritimatiellia bacterium]